GAGRPSGRLDEGPRGAGERGRARAQDRRPHRARDEAGARRDPYRAPDWRFRSDDAGIRAEVSRPCAGRWRRMKNGALRPRLVILPACVATSRDGRGTSSACAAYFVTWPRISPPLLASVWTLKYHLPAARS